jgi:hypothetical protein
MSDTLNKDAADQALANAVDTEEFTFDGVTEKRDPEKLMRVREDLNAEFRTRDKGNVLQRAGHCVMRRG